MSEREPKYPRHEVQMLSESNGWHAACKCGWVASIGRDSEYVAMGDYVEHMETILIPGERNE